MSSLARWLAALRARAWTWWLLPALALGALIGWETDWGRHVLREPERPAPVTPHPAEISVLPEYRLEGGLAVHVETVNRTLFNPTRRPAPTLAAEEAGARRIQRGQFQLVGTAIGGQYSIAFLKETAGGKARAVRQGDQINGMQVALVTADRVLFVAGSDKEELLLKSAPGPKKTAVASPAAPAAPVEPIHPSGVPPPGPAAGSAAPPPPAQAAQPAANAQAARRAARAAAAAAAPANSDMPADSDSSWEAVYRRMQQGNQ